MAIISIAPKVRRTNAVHYYSHISSSSPRVVLQILCQYASIRCPEAFYRKG